MKLLAEYNLVMNKHLSVISSIEKRMSTYLSPTIQYQLIYCLGRKVKNPILVERKEATYFPILLNSRPTPDVSYTDQMAFF